MIETNVFPVLNLSELNTTYKLFKIRGLHPDHDEFEQNRQTLINKISYALKTPIAIIIKDGEAHLAMKDGENEPPSHFELIRATAYFEKTNEIGAIDYDRLNPETAEIGKRFLQSTINMALRGRAELWSPDNGKPLFNHKPALASDGVNIFRGCNVRVIITKDNIVGLCVEVKHSYVSKRSINPFISKEEFRSRNLKGTNAIYHWGSSWFMVKVEEHAGLSISEYMINGVSLRDYVLENAKRPFPRYVAELDPTGSTLQYLNKQSSLMSAPAALLFPVLDTSTPALRKLHCQAILSPDKRLHHIHDFVRNYLLQIEFGKTKIKVDSKSLEISDCRMPVPDLLFGKEMIMSERHTPKSKPVQLADIGKTRLNWLYDPKIGPYGKRHLEQQYFIVPDSVWNTYGPIFLRNLAKIAGKLLTEPYMPRVVIYNDAGKCDVGTQGRAILDAISDLPVLGGFGIVMLHETANRRERERDILAAMVMRELRKRNLYVSVIHSTVPSRSYYFNSANEPKWEVTAEKKQSNKLQGYLRNVAITKILLTNNLWPFILSTPLNADMTIGIDVLYHTACFACIPKFGGDVICKIVDSNQKELLGRKVIQKVLLDILRKESEFGRSPLKSLVIHRDGRLFPDEIHGINSAFRILKNDNIIASDASLSMLEIPKTSPAPIRLFDTIKNETTKLIRNPEIGTYWTATDTDAYVLTTGRAFQHQGTCLPLHIRLLKSGMPIDKLLQDIYSLSCLSWTRPEDCSRIPVTIKLADIRLTENAGGYDEDELEFAEEEDQDE